MDQNENGNKVVPMPGRELIPADFAISLHIRNLMNTYGEEKVRRSIDELFSITTKTEQTEEESSALEGILGF